MSYQPPEPPVKPGPSWGPERLARLVVAGFDGFGGLSFQKLRTHFQGNAVAICEAPENELLSLGLRPDSMNRFLSYIRKTDAEALAADLERTRVDFVWHGDEGYPRLLMEIPDPPIALFYRGTIETLRLPTFAVVGSRRQTPYGERVTRDFAAAGVRAGAVVVSGLAFGIDASAHQSALDAGGICAAVLGSGCDEATVYPRENAQLAERIISGGGVVLSEFPPGMPGLKHHFPLRNRVIAGISRAVLVVEAAAKSGSLITAHLALDQGREVLAVPGPVTSPQSAGTNRLLKLGAIPCLSGDDILEALRLDPSKPSPLPAPPSLSKDAQKVLAFLPHEKHLDEIARDSGLPLSVVSQCLVELEMDGLVARNGGKNFLRASEVPLEID